MEVLGGFERVRQHIAHRGKADDRRWFAKPLWEILRRRDSGTARASQISQAHSKARLPDGGRQVQQTGGRNPRITGGMRRNAID